MKPGSTGGAALPDVRFREGYLEPILRFTQFNPCFILALVTILAVVLIAEREPIPVEFNPSRPVDVTGWVSGPVASYDRSLYFELVPMRLSQKGKPFSIQGNLGIFLSQPSGMYQSVPINPPLQFGELISFNSFLTPPTYYAAPGVDDSRRLARLRGTPYLVQLKSTLQLERSGIHESCLVRFESLLRTYLSRFEEYCLGALDPGAARMVLSSFLGRSFYLNPAERESIQEAGVQHLFVVSGFHIGVVFLAVHLLLRNWGTPGRLITILSAWAYISAVGFSVPATRAGIIATVYYIAISLGISTRSLNTLGLSAILVIAASKDSLFLTSFQFSYTCILAIILVSQPIVVRLGAIKRGLTACWTDEVLTTPSAEGGLQRRARYEIEAVTAFLPSFLLRALRPLARAGYLFLALLVTSVSIQLILLPLILQQSNRWSWLQPLGNLLLVPLFSLILPVAFSLLVLHWTPLATLPVSALNLLCALAGSLLEILDSVNSQIYVAQPSIPVLFGFYATLIVAYLGLPPRIRSIVVILPLLLLILLIQRPGRVDGPLKITMLDVGQGESLHLRYPDGSDALIDTAGSPFARRPSLVSERVVARYLWSQRVRGLRYLLITHPEVDHRGGYRFLADAFSVDRLYYFEPQSDYTGARSQLSSGNSFIHSGVWHGVIHPSREEQSENHNSLSLVISLRYGHFSALLTGDIGAAEETKIQAHLSRITLLKVSHHGSRFSTTSQLLDRITPQVAIISAGRRNAFGHPSMEVLERLQSNGTLAASTSLFGSLRIETDGFNWELTHYSTRSKAFLPLAKGTSENRGKKSSSTNGE